MKLMTIRAGSALIVTLSLLLCASSFADINTRATTQDKEKDKEKKGKANQDKKDKKDKADDVEGTTNLIWRQAGDIESLDLFYGKGGREGAPDTATQFTFVRRSSSGTSEKIIVDDNKGRSWTVKFGPEAKPETSATRILWAAGFHVDEDYFVPKAHINGRGGFEIWDVRFERRDDGYKEIGLWSWTSNPFMGTRELNGLKTVMALLNNWDMKDINNKTVSPNKKSGGNRDELIHYVADLGATLGSTGSVFRKILPFGDPPAGSKGVPESYANQVFIDGIRDGSVVFHYEGKNSRSLEGVSVEHARWMGNLLGRLSDKQISDAFRAGGFSDTEVQLYTRAFRGRLKQLQNLK